MTRPPHDTELGFGDTMITGDASEQPVRSSAVTLTTDVDYPELVEVDPAHYLLVREIARGGMGRIHVARDRRLGREVAIKEVLVRGDSARRRFEREARITARLQHPSIVGVHEAGRWPSGDPFYAMRLVTGRELGEVVAEAKTLAERIALVPNVLAVADAMAYAHGQHVIHRDLKPGNIVVAGFGETVVLDWGLAKVLDKHPRANTDAGDANAESLPGQTTLGEVIGTPAYMPPEQAAGFGVDEHADVYAIGAILYHVLGGRAPYAGSSSAEVIAALMSGPPEPLTELVRDVPEELVAIVEHAMARDVDRRYRTAAELAADLRRFQTGQLVGAHRYTLRALVWRWMRRHRALLITSGIAVVIAVAIGVVALQRVFAAEREVENQRAVALTNQASAEQLMQFMLGDLRDKLKTLGRLDLLDAIARRAASYYDQRGAGVSETDLELMAKAREGVGYVLQTEADLVSARAQLEKSRGAYERLVAEHPRTDRYRTSLAHVLITLGDVVLAQGDSAQALELAKSAVAIAEGPVSSENREEAWHQQVNAHLLLAELAEARGDLSDAIVEARLSLAIADGEKSEDHGYKDRLDLHAMIGRLIYKHHSDVDAALVEARAGLAIGMERMAAQPTVTSWRYDVALSHSEVAIQLLRKNDVAGALEEFHIGTALTDHLVELEPTNAEWSDARASLHEKLGLALLKQHDLEGARDAFEVARESHHTAAERDGSNLAAKFDESVMTVHLGDVRFLAGDFAGALVPYREALAIREQLVAKDPTNAGWRRSVFYCHYKLAGANSELGRGADAVDELRIAKQLAEAEVKSHPTSITAQADLEGALEATGAASHNVHDDAGARAAYEAALAIERERSKDPVVGVAATENVKAIEAALKKLK